MLTSTARRCRLQRSTCFSLICFHPIGAISGRLAHGSLLSSFLSSPLTIPRQTTNGGSFYLLDANPDLESIFLQVWDTYAYCSFLLVFPALLPTAHCPARARRAGADSPPLPPRPSSFQSSLGLINSVNFATAASGSRPVPERYFIQAHKGPA